MKFVLAIFFSFLMGKALAQIDSIRVIEPEKETSFENYELLVVGILGFLILFGFWLWVKHRRKRNHNR